MADKAAQALKLAQKLEKELKKLRKEFVAEKKTTLDWEVQQNRYIDNINGKIDDLAKSLQKYGHDMGKYEKSQTDG